MAVSDILSTAEVLFAVFDKIAFLGLCLYFGNLTFKGWRGAKTLLFKVLMIFLVGMLCFFGGLIVKDFLGWDFFASEYVCSIIVALASYALLWLISSGFKVKDKYATKTDILSLTEDVKKLKIQVAKLTKALEDKNMMPSPLSEEDVKKSLISALHKKGDKSVEVLSVVKSEDSWTCVVKTSKGKEQVIIDAYTGSITESVKITHPLEFLIKNPLSTLGFILSLVFLIFLGVNVSLTTMEAFNEAFDFSFLFEQPLPEGCLTASYVLENFKDNEVTVPINNTRLSNVLSTNLPSFFMIPDKSSAVSLDGELFYITTSYSSQVSSLGSEISVSDWENIYNVRICVIKSGPTFCECIGGSRTDPVFTVPYLVQKGLIEEALQNIILESLTGMFTGGGLLG